MSLQTYATYATIIPTITICSLLLSAYNLFASHPCTLCFSYNYSLFCSQSFCKHYTYSLNLFNRNLNFTTQQHNTRRTELQLTFVCFVLSFYMRTPSVYRIFSKQKAHDLVFSRTLLRPLVYVHSHTCLSFMLVAIGLFERSSMYLLVCICVLCTHCLLLRLLSLCLRYLFLSHS